MLVGIRYCGGCRASFDRKAEAGLVIAAIKESDGARGIDFAGASEGGSYDILLAVCGCLSRCLDTSQYIAKEIVYIYEAGSAAEAAERIIAAQGG